MPVVFLIGVVAIIAARMTRDEIAHALDEGEDACAGEVVAETLSLETDAAEPARSSTAELAATAA